MIAAQSLRCERKVGLVLFVAGRIVLFRQVEQDVEQHFLLGVFEQTAHNFGFANSMGKLLMDGPELRFIKTKIA